MGVPERAWECLLHLVIPCNTSGHPVCKAGCNGAVVCRAAKHSVKAPYGDIPLHTERGIGCGQGSLLKESRLHLCVSERMLTGVSRGLMRRKMSTLPRKQMTAYQRTCCRHLLQVTLCSRRYKTVQCHNFSKTLHGYTKPALQMPMG